MAELTIKTESDIEFNEMLIDKVVGKVKQAINQQKQSAVFVVMGYPVTMKIRNDSIVVMVRNKV